MTFTLRDLLRGKPFNEHDAAQQAEGKRQSKGSVRTTAENIVRPTAEQQQRQAASDRMAKARAAKAAKKAQAATVAPPPAAQAAPKAESNGSDTYKVPAQAGPRKVFLTLLLLAQEQVAEGRNPVVAHWRILQGLQGSGELDNSPRYILQDLERDGFVRQIVTRKGTLCWIPTVLDSSDGRPARAAKGTRTSDLGRMRDALENEYLSSVSPRQRR